MVKLGLILLGAVPGAEKNGAHVLDEKPLDFSRTLDIALLLLPDPRRSKEKENPSRPEHLLFPSSGSSALALVPSTAEGTGRETCSSRAA